MILNGDDFGLGQRQPLRGLGRWRLRRRLHRRAIRGRRSGLRNARSHRDRND
jgi:hypothetical protein